MAAVPQILIVDDEELNLDMLSRRLVRAGYGVETASNGKQALEIAAREAIDLVLLDQMMPGLSGLEVLRELRSRPATRQLPVIMVTALADGAHVAEALDLGADDYVTKPLDFQIAQARIRAQLARRQAQKKLCESGERFELALRGSGKILLDWDLMKDTIYYSPKWFQMLGYEPGDEVNLSEKRFSRAHPSDLPSLMQARKKIDETPLSSLEWMGSHLVCVQPSVEYRIRHRDGRYRWVVLKGMSVHDNDGTPIRIVGGATEITKEKTVDQLTGLPNVQAFSDEIEAAILKRQQDCTTLFAVMLFDLDRFKLIAESLGEAGSNEFLKQVAGKVQTALMEYAANAGQDQNLLVKLARISEDEFGVIIDPLNSRDKADNLPEYLLHAMHSGFMVGEREMICSIKLGTAIYQPEYDDASSLIRDARTAVYAAKTQGTASWKIFDSSMRAYREDRLQMDIDLRLALEREEFEVFYQSRVALFTGRICGFEALIR
jgi:diguanylate cyclase (GGDEF)-like protein